MITTPADWAVAICVILAEVTQCEQQTQTYSKETFQRSQNCTRVFGSEIKINSKINRNLISSLQLPPILSR